MGSVSIPVQVTGAAAQDPTATLAQLGTDLSALSATKLSGLTLQEDSGAKTPTFSFFCDAGAAEGIARRLQVRGSLENHLIQEAGISPVDETYDATGPDTDAPAGSDAECDVLIVTALADTELEWVRKALSTFNPVSGWHKVDYPGTLHPERIKLRAADHTTLNIVAASPDAMGMSAMAIHTTRLALHFKPSFMFLCGIAAADRESGLKLGNVVAFRDTYDHDLGKYETDDQGQRVFKRDGKVIECHSSAASVLNELVAEASNVRFKDLLKERRTVYEERTTETTNPSPATFKISAEQASCVNYVVNHADVLEEVTTRAGRKVTVLEMEAGGFYRACRELNRPGLVVKGISDFAVDKGRFKARGFAAFASAIAVGHQLTTGSPLPSNANAGGQHA